jgi:hypothetical protein
VDSALDGSHVSASLFCTDPILLPSDPPATSSTSHTPSTIHLECRPLTTVAIFRPAEPSRSFVIPTSQRPHAYGWVAANMLAGSSSWGWANTAMKHRPVLASPM